MMRYAVVGVGECGNRLADALADRMQPAGMLDVLRKPRTTTEYLAINTSQKDLEEIERLKSGQILEIDGPPGTGANRALGREAFEDSRAEIQERIGGLEGADAILVVAATGGGTGGAMMPAVVRMVRSMRPSTPVFAVAVLPFGDESEIYHANTAECLADLQKAEASSVILVQNDRVRQPGASLREAYPAMNGRIADRLSFLFTALGSEMEVSSDLGDLLTVADVGSGFSTLGYAEGTRHQPLKEVLKMAFGPDHLLFDADPATEARRALVLIEAEESQLDMDEVLSAISEAGASIGDVFRGIRVAKGPPKALALFSLGRSAALDEALEGTPVTHERSGEDTIGTQLADVEDYELD